MRLLALALLFLGVSVAPVAGQPASAFRLIGENRAGLPDTTRVIAFDIPAQLGSPGTELEFAL